MKNLREILTFLWIVQLILITMLGFNNIGTTLAQPQPEIYIEPSSYTTNSTGQIFNVSVNIRNVEISHRLVTAQFRVGYDPSILQVLNVTEGHFMKSFNNTATPPYTLFVCFIEDDLLYGPNILIGIIIYRSKTGKSKINTLKSIKESLLLCL